jgi:glyceraldehyde-3-phosphate dehydrogenase (NADP+)
METMIKEKKVEVKDTIRVYDPFDNSVVGEVKNGTKKDALKAIENAVKGFEIIRKMTVYQRANILFKTAEIVEKQKEEFAFTIAREGSKTIKEARKEANRCVNTLKISAEEAKRILGETIPFDSFPGGESKLGYFYRQPIGIVLAITPFNDPLNLVAHKLGPAIAAGNSVVLKPATVTPLSAIKLAEAFFEAGLPKECLQVVTGNGSEIGPVLVQDERIRMVSFTGGFEAGKEITKIAGIKKIGMELGSNSPVIVWDDIDVDYAVESCVSGAFWAAGQNCIGVQRIYIHKRIYNEFRDKFVASTLKYKIGNKMQEDCDMGPMITEKEAERVEKWIKEAVSMGAKCLCGGKRKGAIMEPSVLENVPENATIHKEEVFGPAVNLYQIESMDEAIAKANSLPFGLLAAVFCNNINLAMKAAYTLDCGGVIINDSTDYRLDSMPFGGIKNSGLGREGIKFSLQEMTEPKMVCINMMS